MSIKDQHIIPCVYLKYFSFNPTEKRGKRKIACIDLECDRFKIQERRTEKLTIQRRFYSWKKNEQEYDDFVENRNSFFENEFDQIIQNTIKLGDQLSFLNKYEVFENFELSINLKKLIAHLFWRVEARRIEITSFFEPIFIKQNRDKYDLEKFVKVHHLREMGLMTGKTLYSLLGKKICIFISKIPIFITSDNPVIISDGDPHTRTDILDSKSIIQCAVTPKILIVIYPDFKSKPLSQYDLDKLLKVSNIKDFKGEVPEEINISKTIKIKYIDDLKIQENYNNLVLIEAKKWLFSNDENLLKEVLYLLPLRSRERPKITNNSSVFVSSRRRFFNECLRDLDLT
jgi:hypothetical protein